MVFKVSLTTKSAIHQSHHTISYTLNIHYIHRSKPMFSKCGSQIPSEKVCEVRTIICLFTLWTFALRVKSNFKSPEALVRIEAVELACTSSH